MLRLCGQCQTLSEQQLQGHLAEDPMEGHCVPLDISCIGSPVSFHHMSCDLTEFSRCTETINSQDYGAYMCQHYNIHQEYWRLVKHLCVACILDIFDAINLF